MVCDVNRSSFMDEIIYVVFNITYGYFYVIN